MSVLLLFIDGVGIGKQDPSINPLARREHLLSIFEQEPLQAHSDGQLFAVDATFQVPGRPQSASNQTAILTGRAAPVEIGQHILGFPNAALRAIIQEHSIVRRIVEKGKTATFLNAYPAGYLQALGIPHRPAAAPEVIIPEKALRRIKPSATTYSFAVADVPLRTLDDARSRQALPHDLSGARAQSRGFQVPRLNAHEAAEIAWRVARDFDFSLCEHYLADEAGHAQDFDLALSALDTFDDFARAVIASRRSEDHVLICSDHGNVEDLSTRSHTLHLVPILYFGPHQWNDLQFHNVADVGRAVLHLLDIGVV